MHACGGADPHTTTQVVQVPMAMRRHTDEDPPLLQLESMQGGHADITKGCMPPFTPPLGVGGGEREGPRREAREEREGGTVPEAEGNAGAAIHTGGR